MADKKYEVDGKIYCDTDLSEEIGNYGGDLYDLYSEYQKEGLLSEFTLYYSPDCPKVTYESYEELVENYFEDYEVKGEENDIQGKNNRS